MASQRAESLLRSNMDKLELLAEQLLLTESMNYNDIEGILGPRPFPHTTPYRLQ